MLFLPKKHPSFKEEQLITSKTHENPLSFIIPERLRRGRGGEREKKTTTTTAAHKKKTVDEIFVARAGFFLKSKLFFLAVMRVLAEQQAVAVSSIHSVHQHFPGPRAGDEVSLHWVN